jgi:fluoroquinolone resistance protein
MRHYKIELFHIGQIFAQLMLAILILVNKMLDKARLHNILAEIKWNNMDILGTQQEYSDYTFEGITLQQEEVVFKTFENCLFRQCAFIETSLRGCKFLSCTFRECNLTLVPVVDAAFTATKFEDSKVIGVNWTEASWPRRGGLNSIDFWRCVINHSTFIGLNLKKMTLTHCTALDADFAEADLTQADCTDTDFARSRFLHTNLTKADFRGATNYAINATANKLHQTKFALPEAMSLLYSLDIILT